MRKVRVYSCYLLLRVTACSVRPRSEFRNHLSGRGRTRAFARAYSPTCHLNMRWTPHLERRSAGSPRTAPSYSFVIPRWIRSSRCRDVPLWTADDDDDDALHATRSHRAAVPRALAVPLSTTASFTCGNSTPRAPTSRHRQPNVHRAERLATTRPPLATAAASNNR